MKQPQQGRWGHTLGYFGNQFGNKRYKCMSTPFVVVIQAGRTNPTEQWNSPEHLLHYFLVLSSSPLYMSSSSLWRLTWRFYFWGIKWKASWWERRCVCPMMFRTIYRACQTVCLMRTLHCDHQGFVLVGWRQRRFNSPLSPTSKGLRKQTCWFYNLNKYFHEFNKVI